MSSYDIIALGMMDKTLTGNPQTTYWRTVHKRCTKFAIESMGQPFNTTTSFGHESQILINRVGDMVYYVYVRIDLPGIVACDTTSESCAGITPGGQFPVFMDGGAACNPCAKMDEAALVEYLPTNFDSLGDAEKTVALRAAKDVWRKEKYGAGSELNCCIETEGDDPSAYEELGDTWSHWCNDIGHFAISKASLVIGGQKVDTLWSTFLFIWEELTGKSGRRLTEMTGRRYTRASLVCDSRQKRTLYVPLPFWFTNVSGSALPLASLAYHGVQLNIEFEKLENLIVTSGSHVAVRNARTNLALTPNDLQAEMEISYVFLEQTEREKFQNSHFEQLIVQTQHYFKTESKQICRIPLAFNHPTSEIMFVVRRQCQERCNNWTNFSGVDGRDPIETAELLLNTTSRFGEKPAPYYRCVVPYQVHCNIPESHIYVMSFALEPESFVNPSGSCNLSRIDSIELMIKMQAGLENESYTVHVFSRSWNLMRFREGVAGAAYQ